MLYYCMKCSKNTESKNPKVVKAKNGRIIYFIKCAVCNITILKFNEEQEAKGLLSKLAGIRVLILSDLPRGNILF